MLLSQETILTKSKASREVNMSKERQRGQESHNQYHSNTHSKELAKPQQKSAANNPTGEKKIEDVGLHNPGRTVFDCVIPKVIIFPVDIPRLFEGEDIPKEELQKEVQKLEQEWLENLKTMNRQELEGELRQSEGIRDSYPKWRKKWQTKEQIQQLEWQLEVIGV